MRTTCGIYLFLPNNKFLICHPTNHGPTFFSIPKGIVHEGEEYWDAAKRELLEETSLDLDNYTIENIIELPMNVYNRGDKQLKSFYVKITENICDAKLECISMVKCDIPFPECDEFRWLTIDEGIVFLHESQRRNKEQLINIING